MHGQTSSAVPPCLEATTLPTHRLPSQSVFLREIYVRDYFVRRVPRGPILSDAVSVGIPPSPALFASCFPFSSLHRFIRYCNVKPDCPRCQRFCAQARKISPHCPYAFRKPFRAFCVFVIENRIFRRFSPFFRNEKSRKKLKHLLFYQYITPPPIVIDTLFDICWFSNTFILRNCSKTADVRRILSYKDDILMIY